jgi:hypothetical protein
MHRPTLALSLSLAAFFSAATASAQRTVLVLPWAVGEEDAATLAARTEAVATGLSSGELTALAPDAARTRFEAAQSAEPPAIDDDELDHWLSLSRAAIRQLARTDYVGARASLLEAHTLPDRAAVTLDREEARARQVLDTCLYEVRAFVETHEDAHAAARALECRQLVPRIAPSPYNHTPEVAQLLDQVDRALSATPIGALQVVSEPEGCAVRLNGVVVGATPYTSASIAPGTYGVQVECEGARGRVHVVTVGEAARTIVVDPRFDAAVRSDALLRLAYATTAIADERRLRDAVRLATSLEADEVWLLSLEAGDVVRLDRVIVSSSTPLASVRANGLAGLGAAVASLTQAHSEDRTGADPIALVRWRGGAISEGHVEASFAWGRADWEVGVGVALGVVALSAFATSLALADDDGRLGLASASTPLSALAYLPTRDAWEAQRTTSWAFGLAGGAIGTLAVSLAMEEEHGIPWWSWALSGAGLVGALTGATLIGTSTSCGIDQPSLTCVAGSQNVDLGVSALGMSLPLLSVPFVFLAREVVRGGVIPSIEVTGQSAMLRAAGTF